MQTVLLIVTIALVIVIGVCLALGVFAATEGEWVSFSVYVSVAVGLIVVVIPLYYYGDRYVCPKCGQVFRVNPYKMFFTNGIFGIFEFGPPYSKRYNLTCPCCKEKVYCRRSK